MQYIQYQIHLLLQSKYKFLIMIVIYFTIYLSFYGNNISYCINEETLVHISEFAPSISYGFRIRPVCDITTINNIGDLQYFLTTPPHILKEYQTPSLHTWYNCLNNDFTQISETQNSKLTIRAIRVNGYEFPLNTRETPGMEFHNNPQLILVRAKHIVHKILETRRDSTFFNRSSLDR